MRYLRPAVIRDAVPANQIGAEVHPHFRAAAGVRHLATVAESGSCSVVAFDDLVLVVELFVQTNQLAVGRAKLFCITAKMAAVMIGDLPEYVIILLHKKQQFGVSSDGLKLLILHHRLAVVIEISKALDIIWEEKNHFLHHNIAHVLSSHVWQVVSSIRWIFHLG